MEVENNSPETQILESIILESIKTDTYYKEQLSEKAKKELENIEKEHPLIVAATIRALEWANDKFGDNLEFDSDSYRMEAINGVYKIFQVMLRPEDYPKAAEITFKMDFWKNALTQPPTDPDKIAHIIDANGIEAQVIAEYLENKGITAVKGLDLGVGGANTAQALLNALKAKKIEVSIVGSEISQELWQSAKENKGEGLTNLLNSGELKVEIGSMDEFLKAQEPESIDFITANYSLHHLQMPHEFLKAVQDKKITVEDDQVFFNGQKLIKLSELQRIDPDKASVIRYGLGKNDNVFEHKYFQNSPQVQALKDCYRALKPGGILAIADPGKGLSKGFNTFFLGQSIKTARGNNEAIVGLGGISEVGMACFTSLEEMKIIAEMMGFQLEHQILQYADEDGKYQKVENNEIDNFIEGARGIDPYLGYVLILRKPEETHQAKKSTKGAIERASGGNILFNMFER